MRLILLLLATANTRWSAAQLARCERLDREADAALAAAKRYHANARRFVQRIELLAA